jgi:hypothetical protein
MTENNVQYNQKNRVSECIIVKPIVLKYSK